MVREISELFTKNEEMGGPSMGNIKEGICASMEESEKIVMKNKKLIKSFTIGTFL
jgi:hypothetical protein